MREFDVDISTIANMEVKVTVQVETEGKTEKEILNEAEQLAIKRAESGDVFWEYVGLVEPEDFTIAGVSELK